MGSGEKSTIRVSDALACHRLVHELMEVGPAPEAWQTHLATSLERMVGGFGGAFFGCESGLLNWRSPDHRLSAAADDQMEERFRACITEGGHSILPGVEALERHSADDPALVISAATLPGGLSKFHSSEFYSRYVGVFGTGDLLASYSWRSGEAFCSLSILREKRDRKFSARSRAILGFLCDAVREQSGRNLLGSQSPFLKRVSPRQRQTLSLLLDGLSEKAIAEKMGIKRDTVHEYVVGLYRNFHVNSRSELMALFVRGRSLPRF